MVRAMQQRAYAAFREAVLDLAAEPTPLNVQRYLAASRILERCTPAAATQKPKPRSRPTHAHA
jgi:hypothetical protein